MSGRKIVITGIGMVTPLGPDVRSSWAAMLAGKSGISRLTAFDVTGHTVKIGGQIKKFDLSKHRTFREYFHSILNAPSRILHHYRLRLRFFNEFPSNQLRGLFIFDSLRRSQ